MCLYMHGRTEDKKCDLFKLETIENLPSQRKLRTIEFPWMGEHIYEFILLRRLTETSAARRSFTVFTNLIQKNHDPSLIHLNTVNI